MTSKDDFKENVFESIFALGRNFLAQGNYEKALIIFDGLVALFPHQLSCNLAYAEALLMSGEFTEALEFFLGLNDRFAQESSILLGSARAYMMLGQHHEAQHMVQPILEGLVTSNSAERAIANSIFLAANNWSRKQSSFNEN